MIPNPDIGMENSVQLFTVNLSELENRLDPHFYQPSYSELVEKISRNKTFKLGDLVSISNETWNQKDFYEIKFPYIEISEIDLLTGQINNIKNVPIIEAPSRAKKIVREGDMIVSTTRPSRGAISLISKEQNLNIASTGFSVLRDIKKPDLITKEYLFWILRQSFSLLQMEQRSSGGNYPAITEDELKRILIPVFDSKIQDYIISTLKVAIEKRSNKKAEAQTLLDSIDSYLLQELGINLNKRDHNITKRIFTIPFSQSTGNRFDPLFFYQNFLDELPNGKYDVQPLGKHVNYMITGFAAGKLEQSSNPEDPIQIRPTNISDKREFLFERNIYIPSSAIETRKADLCQHEEILFNNTNSQELVGKSVLFNLKGNYFCSNHMTRIRTEKSLNPSFLNHLFNLYQRNQVFYKLCTNWNNQSGVNVQVLNKLPIPLPGPDEQKVIADTIDEKRKEAQRLEQEANAILGKARQQVEELVLKP